MANVALQSVSDLLLTRRGIVFVASSSGRVAEQHLRAVELELATLQAPMAAC
jgi:hypothetical protein